MLNFILEVFDLFSFKKKFTETINVENFLLIKSIIKEEIINQSIKNINGSQKMENVVNCVNSFIDKHVTTDNKIVEWIINIIKKYINVFAQTIYDDLKDKVKGL